MSDDPFGSLDPSSSGGPIEEPRLGFLGRLFRRRKRDASQMPEEGMLDFESGPPVGHQAPSTPAATSRPAPTPTGGPAPGQTTPPTWPTPVRVFSSGGFPVGPIVVMLIVIVVFAVGVVSCVVNFDEGFDTADEIIDDFSNDFSAEIPAAAGSGGDAESAAAVDAYCETILEYVQLVRSEPASPRVQELSQELTERSQALATVGLSAEDGQRVSECSQQASQVGAGG